MGGFDSHQWLQIYTYPQSSHLKGFSPLWPALAVSNKFITNFPDQATQTLYTTE